MDASRGLADVSIELAKYGAMALDFEKCTMILAIERMVRSDEEIDRTIRMAKVKMTMLYLADGCNVSEFKIRYKIVDSAEAQRLRQNVQARL